MFGDILSGPNGGGCWGGCSALAIDETVLASVEFKLLWLGEVDGCNDDNSRDWAAAA